MKVARTFTIDVNVAEAAKRSLPNMSEAVENALRDAVTNIANKDPGPQRNPFKGVKRSLLSNALYILNKPTKLKATIRGGTVVNKEQIPRIEVAQEQTSIINTECGTNVTPKQLINYYESMELI